MADESLSVSITADTGSASSAIADLDARLASLEQAFVSSAAAAGTSTVASTENAAATTAVAGAHEKAAASVAAHAEAEQIFGASAGRAEVVTNSLARALSSVGIESGAASERVFAFGEALDAVGRSAGPLLAVGAALIAIGAASSFLKDAVKDAADWQSQMASLGQAVKNQGGDWNTAQEGVNRWLDALETATGYAKNEALTAFNQLVAAHVSDADAEKIVTIATDVAAGAHKNLGDVVHSVTMAELGRARSLEQNDIVLKALVKSNGDLNEAMNELERNYSGQAAASLDTYEGKNRALQAALEAVRVEVGTALLPILTEFSGWLIDAVHYVDDFAHNAVAAFASVGQAAALMMQAIGSAIRASTSELQAAASQESGLNAGEFGGGPANAIPPGGSAEYNDLAGAWSKLNAGMSKPLAPTWGSRSGAAAIAAARKALQGVMDRPLDFSPTLGSGGGAKGSKEIFNEADIQDSAKTNQYADAQKKLDEAIKSLTDSELSFKAAVSSAATEQEKQLADLNMAQKESADANTEVKLLTTAISQQTTEQAALTKEHTSQAAAAEALRAKHNQLVDEYRGEVGVSQQVKVEAADLSREYQSAKTAADATASSLRTVTDDLAKNQEALVKAKVETQNYANELDKLSAALDKKVQAELEKDLAALQKGIETQQQQDAEYQQTIAKDNGESLAQQVAFLKKRYDDEVSADGEYSAEALKTRAEIIKLEEDGYKQQLDAQKKWVDDANKDVSTFLDSLITQHKSLRDSLKTIWDDILKNMVDTIGKMIVETSLFKNIFGSMIPGAIPSGSGVGSSVGGVGVGLQGLIGSLLGPTAATQAQSSMVTGAQQGGLAGAFVGGSGATDVASAIGAGSAAGGTFSDVLTGGYNTVGGVGNSDWSTFGASGESALGSNIPSGVGGLKGTVGGVMSGLALGSLLNGLTGGNTGNSTIGSVLGAGVGAIAGPVGSTIGGALGGLIGGLFGPHWGPPQNYPDRSDTQNYGTTMADLEGRMVGPLGPNNQTFNADSSILGFMQQMGVSGAGTSGPGGTNAGGIDAVEVWLSQQNPNNPPAGYTQSQWATQLTTWQQAFGTSATGTGQLTFPDKNVGDILVTGAGNTQMTNYTQFETYLQTILGLTSGAVATNAITHLYPDLNQTAMINAQGQLLGPNGLPTTAGGGTASLRYPSVTVNVAGSIVGPGGIQSVAQTLSVAMQQIWGGTLPGNATVAIPSAGDSR